MEAKVIDGCISCGACIATCPEVFRFDEDGLAEAYAKVTPEHESAAIEAKRRVSGGCYYDRRIKRKTVCIDAV